MSDVLANSIGLNELYELIDLYKYASIEGEKVNFIVNSLDNNKRLITIELQNDHLRDRDTFVFDDGDMFDKYIYPKLLSYFSCDDALGKWDIFEPEKTGSKTKCINETRNGNIVYYDTYNKEIIDTLNDNVEKEKEETTYKTETLTNDDKIWDEIILYVKDRRQLIDYYNGSGFNEEEIKTIYNFVTYLAENKKEINIGKSKKSRENNEEYLNKLFEDRNQLLEMGLTNEIIDKIIANSSIQRLAFLASIEKRVRNRLDLSDETIKSKIDFALKELDKVNFFNLKNADNNQFKNKQFIESKPKSINKLLEKFNNDNSLYEETKMLYIEYSNELLEYLERKSMNGKKIVKSNENLDDVKFVEYHDEKMVEEEKKEKETPTIEQNDSLEDALLRLEKEICDYPTMEEEISPKESLKQNLEDIQGYLFDIIELEKEQKESEDLKELKDAYEEALSYSVKNTPAAIKIIFDKNNKSEADVIISNTYDLEDVVIYQRTFSKEKLNDEIMPLLIDLYSRENALKYNIKLDVAGTDDANLIISGLDHKTFKIIYGEKDFVDKNQELLKTAFEEKEEQRKL